MPRDVSLDIVDQLVELTLRHRAPNAHEKTVPALRAKLLLVTGQVVESYHRWEDLRLYSMYWKPIPDSALFDMEPVPWDRVYALGRTWAHSFETQHKFHFDVVLGLSRTLHPDVNTN